MTQRSERKVQNTFETPYKVFTHSDKWEENDKLTLNRQRQRVIQSKEEKDVTNPKKVSWILRYQGVGDPNKDTPRLQEL